MNDYFEEYYFRESSHSLYLSRRSIGSTLYASSLTPNLRSTTPLSPAFSAIDLLREYQTRLVVDVLTGKLDVREATCLLPAETVQESLTCEAVEDDAIEFKETTDAEA